MPSKDLAAPSQCQAEALQPVSHWLIDSVMGALQEAASDSWQLHAGGTRGIAAGCRPQRGRQDLAAPRHSRAMVFRLRQDHQARALKALSADSTAQLSSTWCLQLAQSAARVPLLPMYCQGLACQRGMLCT